MGYFTFISVVCSLGLLTSCSTINDNSIYDANSLNIPLHKEKKEVKGSAGYGGILGFNADASFTASDMFVLKAGGNYNHQYLYKTGFMGNEYYLDLKNHYLEGAAGYYKFLENSFVNSIELSAGYGNGLTKKTKENLHSGGDGFEGSYQKYFLQFNAGHVTDKLELGIGARYSRIFYPTLSRKNFSLVSEQTDISQNMHWPSLEIAMLHAVGGKNLKATLQYGLAIPLKQANFSFESNGNTYTYGVENMSFIFQIGIRYSFLLAKPEKI